MITVWKMALKEVPSKSVTFTWWPVMSESTNRNRSRFWSTSFAVSGPLRSSRFFLKFKNIGDIDNWELHKKGLAWRIKWALLLSNHIDCTMTLITLAILSITLCAAQCYSTSFWLTAVHVVMQSMGHVCLANRMSTFRLRRRAMFRSIAIAVATTTVPFAAVS